MTTTALEETRQNDLAPVTLWGRRSAEEIVKAATETAEVLAKVIESRELYVSMGTDRRTGKERRHVVVEGWTTLGSMLGVQPFTEWSRPLPDGSGWEARVLAQTLDGRVVGSAESMCSRDEEKWQDSDDYAIRSMAQTRATAKALATPLRFVVALAGFDTTPAEEMQSESGRKRLATKKQTDYIVRLADKLGHKPAEMSRYLQKHYKVEKSTALQAAHASELIERMKEGPLEIPDAPDAGPEPTPDATTRDESKPTPITEAHLKRLIETAAAAGHDVAALKKLVAERHEGRLPESLTDIEGLELIAEFEAAKGGEAK